MSIEVNNESGVAVDEAEFAALARFVLDAMHLHPLTDLSVVMVTVDGGRVVRTRRRDRAFFGTGDLFAGLFLGHYLAGRDPARAVTRSVAGLDVVTEATEAAGSVDLALIPNLPAIVAADRPGLGERL